MDLRTFVAETLRQIVGGVADAQASVAALGTNARINPAMVADTAKRKSAPPSPVEFDVAVTVAEKSSFNQADSECRSESLISVVSAERSLVSDQENATSRRNEAVSRVRFTVQLSQPSDVETYSTNIPTMASMGRSRYDELKDY